MEVHRMMKMNENVRVGRVSTKRASEALCVYYEITNDDAFCKC